jgi:hypothetical protein
MNKPPFSTLDILWEYDPKAEHNKRFVKKKVLVDIDCHAEIERWIDTPNLVNGEWIDSEPIPGRAVSSWSFLHGVSLTVFNPPIDFFLFDSHLGFEYRNIIGGYEMALATEQEARDRLFNPKPKKKRRK